VDRADGPAADRGGRIVIENGGILDVGPRGKSVASMATRASKTSATSSFFRG
jgi:hypothetical protein